MIGETPYLEFDEQRTEAESKPILDKIKELQDAQAKGEDVTKIKDWELALQNPYFKPTDLTGKYLSKAVVVFDQTTYNPQIQLQFNQEGEKLFEEILTAEEGTIATQNQKIFIAKLSEVNQEGLQEGLEKLKKAAEQGNKEEIADALKELVPNYGKSPDR